MWQRACDPSGKLSGSIRKGHTAAPRRWERRKREAEGGSTRTRRAHSVVRPTKITLSNSDGKKIGNRENTHVNFEIFSRRVMSELASSGLHAAPWNERRVVISSESPISGDDRPATCRCPGERSTIVRWMPALQAQAPGHRPQTGKCVSYHASSRRGSQLDNRRQPQRRSLCRRGGDRQVRPASPADVRVDRPAV